MSELLTVPRTLVDANPFRCFKVNPINSDIVKELQESVEDIGFFEGVIARPKNSRYQLAFGHHRMAAARAAGINKVPLIVRELDDDMMIRLMMRENMTHRKKTFADYYEGWLAINAGHETCLDKVDRRMTLAFQLCSRVSKAIKAGAMSPDELHKTSLDQMVHHIQIVEALKTKEKVDRAYLQAGEKQSFAGAKRTAEYLKERAADKPAPAPRPKPEPEPALEDDGYSTDAFEDLIDAMENFDGEGLAQLFMRGEKRVAVLLERYHEAARNVEIELSDLKEICK